MASWPGIKDGTSTPQFDVNAVLTVLTDTVSNPIFQADFPVGGKGLADFTLDLPDGTTLTSSCNRRKHHRKFLVWRGCSNSVARPRACIPYTARLGIYRLGVAGTSAK